MTSPRACSQARLRFAHGAAAVGEKAVADALVVGHQVADGVVAVVNDDQLELRIVLPQEVVDGARHEATPVVGGHDAGDERAGGARSDGLWDGGREDCGRGGRYGDGGLLRRQGFRGQRLRRWGWGGFLDGDEGVGQLDQAVVAAGEQLIDELDDAGVVVGIVVEQGEAADGEPAFEAAEIAADVDEVVQAVDEQQMNRLVPFDLEGGFANRFDLLGDAGRGEVAHEAVEGGPFAGEALVLGADPAVMGIDGPDARRGMERTDGGGKHGSGTAAVAADLDEIAGRVGLAQRLQGGGQQQLAFGRFQPALDAGHGLEDGVRVQELRFGGRGLGGGGRSGDGGGPGGGRNRDGGPRRAAASDGASQGVFVSAGDGVHPEGGGRAEGVLEVAEREAATELHVAVAGWVAVDLEAEQGGEGREQDFFGGPDARPPEDVAELAVGVEESDQLAASLGGEDGGGPEGPVNELVLAGGEAA